jgi:hypothetical protein
VKYDEFRTGLTFTDVRQMLAVEATTKFDSTGERMFVTRRTVLGRWYQLKRESWEAYQAYKNTEGDDDG